MKPYKTIALLLLGLSLSVSIAQETIEIKLNVAEDGTVTVESVTQTDVAPEPEPIPEPVEPEQPQPDPTEFLFPSDWLETPEQSTPSELTLPKGIANLFDVEYKGAFRVSRGSNDMSSSFAVGALGIDPVKQHLFIAGHEHFGAIGSYVIPDDLSLSDDPKNIVNADIAQAYTKVVSTRTGRQDDDMRVAGVLYHDNKIIVTSNVWYDAGTSNKRHVQILDANNIVDGSNGFLSIDGNAYAAGYMSKIPSEWQEDFNATHIIGWASNFSITSRYSQGPSLFTFDPNQAITASENVETKPYMYYPLNGGELVEGGSNNGSELKEGEYFFPSPIWSSTAKARYGFIVPNSDYFLVLGWQGGLNGGIGYKITQDNGNICDGQCSFINDDYYNYFWVYKVSDILSADKPSDPRPISYGKWSHPFDNQTNQILGAAFDEINDMLYVSLKNAARTGQFDRPPMIIAYKITTKANN